MKNNKRIKLYKYANEYIDILNTFYEKHKNSIDENVLGDEYDLMTDVLDNLIYDRTDSWYIHFNKNKYRNHIIYKTDKSTWKALSKRYKKMWKITFGF